MERGKVQGVWRRKGLSVMFQTLEKWQKPTTQDTLRIQLRCRGSNKTWGSNINLQMFIKCLSEREWSDGDIKMTQDVTNKANVQLQGGDFL